ncbi:MAG: hypothetical protein HOG03_09015 [Desulfobacula sp.]|jgi:hypothetical protein|uniref:hypothetical protein n=1 Tax=Desulfobacula sp. TaxID=2593537 RepID=UPI001DB8E3C3|nr:hypothetical protein [Desulfobacula sp.]MBT3485265.1 hypothetical protein [Desulfobacula sp.]MBT3804728.1 hypothetical protein [Desulfobacula sp.]MBT4025206.1 hypothetical protein [Desulfobacula sp.]MBT4200662.1 hypothetical protein [Desulfobacula sp.]
MRQKIRFEKNMKAGKVIILESSEVDPGVVLLLHEEEYGLEEMIKASAGGVIAFSEFMRRRSFFPTTDLCNKLFENTIEFFKNKAEEKIIIEYNDIEAFPKEEKFQLEDEDVEIDKILEEDGETSEDEIKEIDSEDDTPKFKPEDTSEHEN